MQAKFRDATPNQPLKSTNRNRTSLRVCLRISGIAGILLFLQSGTLMQGQELFKSEGTAIVENASHPENPIGCRIIYLGFVGALEPPNNKHSGVVQIRQALQDKKYSDVCA